MRRSTPLFIAFIIFVAWTALTTASDSSKVMRSEPGGRFRARILIRFIHQKPSDQDLFETIEHLFYQIFAKFLLETDGWYGFIWSNESKKTKEMEIWPNQGPPVVNDIKKAVELFRGNGTAKEIEEEIQEMYGMPAQDSLQPVTMRIGIAASGANYWTNATRNSKHYLQAYNLSVVAIIPDYEGNQMRAFIDSIYDENPTTDIPITRESYHFFSQLLMEEISNKVQLLLSACQWEMIPVGMPCHFQPFGPTCINKECGTYWFNHKVTGKDKYKQFCQHNITWDRCGIGGRGNFSECEQECRNGTRVIKTPCNATCSDRDGMEEIGIDNMNYFCCDDIVSNEWRTCNLTSNEIATCDAIRREPDDEKKKLAIIIGVIFFLVLLFVFLVSIGAIACILLRKRQRALRTELDSLGGQGKMSMRMKKKQAGISSVRAKAATAQSTRLGQQSLKKSAMVEGKTSQTKSKKTSVKGSTTPITPEAKSGPKTSVRIKSEAKVPTAESKVKDVSKKSSGTKSKSSSRKSAAAKSRGRSMTSSKKSGKPKAVWTTKL